MGHIGVGRWRPARMGGQGMSVGTPGQSTHGVTWDCAGGVRWDGMRAWVWGVWRRQKACGTGGRSAWRAARGVGGMYSGRVAVWHVLGRRQVGEWRVGGGRVGV